MTPLTCAATRRRLEAFHDRELPVRDQIAVGAHVEWCERCAAELADLRAMRAAVAALTPRRALSNEEAAVFSATVINRLKAEQDASLFARVRTMFDDIRLVYAGLGAAGATVVCVIIMLGMMRFATIERPDSLAAIVNLVSTPLECESGNDFGDASGCRARWEARFQRANESAEVDSVFALDEVVTHKSGHLTNLEVLRAGRRSAASQAQMIEGLLDAVSRSRLEGTPAAPISAGMLWMVEHATVRAAKPIEPLAPIPSLIPKKRIAVGHGAASFRA